MWRKLGLPLVAVLALGCSDEDSQITGTGGGGGSGGNNTGGASSSGTGGAGGSATNGCGTGTLAPGDHTFPLTHDGMERSYNLHVPPGYDDVTALPLVLNFHGFTSNPDEQAQFSALNTLADSEGFAVAYPEGYMNSFNAGIYCCGNASSEAIDDVGFTRQIVADVLAKGCIDEKRVYATGMSNGGFMSHRLVCDAADLVAAVAPVDGPLGVPPGECSPSRNVPMIHFYGTADPLVDYAFATATNDHWVSTYGCTDASPEVTYDQGAASCETWDECEGGVTLTFCSITGMGHCWPGQSFCPSAFGTSNTDISANTEMWALFQQHQLP